MKNLLLFVFLTIITTSVFQAKTVSVNASTLDVSAHTRIPLADAQGSSGRSAINENADKYRATNSVMSDDNGVIFVKADGSGDGSSWDNATGDLQAAIIAATTGVREVWVAKGTYWPNRAANNLSVITLKNKDNAFVLSDGVKVYGGFAGDETLLSDRNLAIKSNASILSGDFNGDDSGFTNNAENAWHVVLSVSDGVATVLDGFTVSGGNASATGSLTVESKSISRGTGGGIYNCSSLAQITNCIFTGNMAMNSGGGMFNGDATLAVISNCQFIGNILTGDGNYLYEIHGAGIYNLGSNVKINRCIFYGNIANSRGSFDTYGGGISNVTSLTTIENCAFIANVSQNSAGRPGYGGGISNMVCAPIIRNCTFTGNEAKTNGGGIFYNYAGGGSLTNCILYENTCTTSTPNRDEIYRFSNIIPFTVSNNIIRDYNPGASNFYSSVTGIITANPMFANRNDPDGPDDIYGTADDGLRLLCSSPALDAGTDTDAPLTDILGNSRQGTTDVGAYEYHAPTGITPDPNGVVFVRSLSCGGDGSSWENATNDLQAAMMAANTGVREVWVAKGTYLPNRSIDNLEVITPGNRDNAFVLSDGVKVYGGFAGTEAQLTDRNLSIKSNASILSGDFDRNDDGLTNNSENAFHVAVSVNDGEGTVLDGFTISGGNATGEGSVAVEGREINRAQGGGLYNFNNTIRIKNCLFTGNLASIGGGGIMNDGKGDAVIDQCQFVKNELNGGPYFNEHVSGGGVYVMDGKVTIANCLFRANILNALQGTTYGGGVASFWGSVTIDNCVFFNNESNGSVAYPGYGGGLSQYLGTSMMTRNCTFKGNHAKSNGGGIYYSDYSDGRLTNSIVYGNTCSLNTPNRMEIYRPSMTLWHLKVTVSHSIIKDYLSSANNAYTSGPGITNADPMFADSLDFDGPDNLFGTDDDGLRLLCNSAAINTGDNYDISEKDITGSLRIVNTIVDMGAYEAPESGTAGIALTGTQRISKIQAGITAYATCDNIMATLQSAGGTPVGGITTARLWVADTQLTGYVKRHHEIMPDHDAAAVTGKVTLYFTDAEFAGYNGQTPAPAFPLPVSTDQSDVLAAAKRNLRIEKRGGRSSDGTGLVGTYTGSVEYVNPDDDDIQWNASANRWEVSFMVTGFGGFWIKSREHVSLSGLSLSTGTLTPVFSGSQKDYAATVGGSVGMVKVTPSASTGDATIQVKVNAGTYADVISGSESGALSLIPGPNTILVKVSDTDGLSESIYTIIVTRPFTAPGNALLFDGVDDEIVLNDNPAGQVGFADFEKRDFTIEMYIRTTKTTGSGSILNKRDVCGFTSYIDFIVVNGNIKFVSSTNTSGLDYHPVQGTSQVADGKWHHVAVTRAKLSESDDRCLISLYVDGKLDIAFNAPGTAYINNNVPVRIGNSVCTDKYTGSIDELRIWGVAKTQAQLQAGRFSPPVLPATDLLAYYNFDIGKNETASVFTDLSGSEKNGMLRNFSPENSRVESYAMVVPATASASDFTSTSFVANWVEPVTGTAEKYLLDVSTSDVFGSGSFLAGYEAREVTGVSEVVSLPAPGSGRINATATYYYRVRADKSSVTGQGGYSPTEISSFNPLPVRLISFSGRNHEHTHLLEWKVSEEMHLETYAVERSFDGKAFERIGAVAAGSNGKAGVSSYTYTDQALAVPPVVYYRLRMIDYDGSFALSGIVPIAHTQERSASIATYPNPVTSGSEIFCNIRTHEAGNWQTEIYNASGGLIRTSRLTLQSGLNTVRLTLSDISPGVYLIKFTNHQNRQEVKKIIVE